MNLGLQGHSRVGDEQVAEVEVLMFEIEPAGRNGVDVDVEGPGRLRMRVA